MSLLSVVQQAFGEIGLAPPASVVGNSDPNVIQALALSNRSGVELRNAPKAASYWQVLRKQFLFNLQGLGPFSGRFTPGSAVITNVTGAGLAGVLPLWQISSLYAATDTMVVSVDTVGLTVTMSQTCTLTAGSSPATDTTLAFGQEAYPYPADLQHFIPSSDWDRSFRWQMLGPLTEQEWQVVKSGISPVGPRLRYRLMQGQIYVNPAPYVPVGFAGPISDQICMPYASKWWAAPAGTVSPAQPTQEAFQLDTDISMAFPDNLLVLSLKWRFLKAKGMGYDDEFQEYQDELDMVSARATNARILPLNANARRNVALLSDFNVPDTGFGQ